MTERSDREAGQQELLPGLRASVVDSQAKARHTRARHAAEVPVAELDPVARVLVDVPLAHLDRTFDYAVPAPMALGCQPGVRVKVRFAGQDVDGFVLERTGESDHTGRLTPLRRVVSPEPVLTPALAGLVDDVARRYAGVRSDVLRLAVPPRHATTEKAPGATASPGIPTSAADSASGSSAWGDYQHADLFLDHLRTGGSPRAVWSAAPAADWPQQIAQAAAATRASGRGVLVCVPDVKDVARIDAALTAALGPDQHVTLTAESGPAARYRDFLAVCRGQRQVVVGVRAACFAPVLDLGLVVIWDDGDDLYAEPRAPYPHTREVLLLRAARESTAVLVGGFGRSVEAQQLLTTGWAQPLDPGPGVSRQRARVSIAGGADHDLQRDPHTHAARMPRRVYEVIRQALVSGPVLVQTPRAGYALALACERCRTPARCTACAGPLALSGPTTPPRCRWCGTDTASWACPQCHAGGLRAPVLGDLRTGEELGRAFPSTRVRTSSAETVLARVGVESAIVVATPGAEPVAELGYAAVVVLDSWLLLARDDLRAGEEAVRRWSNAAGLVRAGGEVIAVGDPAEPALQALVRWDQPGYAERETQERQAAHLPPAARIATLTGELGAVDDAVTLLDLPEPAEVLGPVRSRQVGSAQAGSAQAGSAQAGSAQGPGDQVRVVVRVPRALGGRLEAALSELQRVRSARKLDPVRVQVDPIHYA